MLLQFYRLARRNFLSSSPSSSNSVYQAKIFSLVGMASDSDPGLSDPPVSEPESLSLREIIRQELAAALRDTERPPSSSSSAGPIASGKFAPTSRLFSGLQLPHRLAVPSIGQAGRPRPHARREHRAAFRPYTCARRTRPPGPGGAPLAGTRLVAEPLRSRRAWVRVAQSSCHCGMTGHGIVAFPPGFGQHWLGGPC